MLFYVYQIDQAMRIHLCFRSRIHFSSKLVDLCFFVLNLIFRIFLEIGRCIPCKISLQTPCKLDVWRKGQEKLPKAQPVIICYRCTFLKFKCTILLAQNQLLPPKSLTRFRYQSYFQEFKKCILFNAKIVFDFFI